MMFEKRRKRVENKLYLTLNQVFRASHLLILTLFKSDLSISVCFYPTQE